MKNWQKNLLAISLVAVVSIIGSIAAIHFADKDYARNIVKNIEYSVKDNRVEYYETKEGTTELMYWRIDLDNKYKVEVSEKVFSMIKQILEENKWASNKDQWGLRTFTK